MAREITNVEAGQLEQLIDAVSLNGVLAALHIICHEKADHVRVNWQDDPLARDWERIAKRIDAIANHASARDL